MMTKKKIKKKVVKKEKPALKESEPVQEPKPVSVELPSIPAPNYVPVGDVKESLEAPDLFLALRAHSTYRSAAVSKALEYVPSKPFTISDRIDKTPAGVWLDFLLLFGCIFFSLFAAWIWFIWRV
jgi:hypothetical protein